MECEEEIQVACDEIICKKVEKELEDIEAQVECLDEEGGTQRS
jgi:hypothetical protein